jgi:adenine-specific DNA-methyltransferase
LSFEEIDGFREVELEDGSVLKVDANIIDDIEYDSVEDFLKKYPKARFRRADPLTSGGERKNQSLPFTFEGKTYSPPKGNCWKTTVQTDDGSIPGMEKLARNNRLIAKGTLYYKRYHDDFEYKEMSNWWDNLGGASKPVYVVQTNAEIIKRLILMTTDPGDLVLDPTCGSGTTAFVAEQWGRRWITIDTSRIALNIAKQRLMTAVYPYYNLYDEKGGDIRQGFKYKTVPHITLKSLVNDEPTPTETLYDQPEINKIKKYCA